MKFTVISHACLYVEHLNTRLLIDPWFIGSCYWRSWWNYPEPNNDLISSLKPTHVYISHLHWDHYHGPSLRKIQKFQPEIIFPKHFNKRMVGDCKRGFDFKNIVEIDHGTSYEIGDEFKLTSYQFNPIVIDSSVVIEAGNVTLLNSNDAKVFGLSLKQITSSHGNFDFVFRSHSSAAPIPHCIKGADPRESNRSPKDYCNDFVSFGKATGAKYCIPFASSHYFLHPKTKKFNEYYSNPKLVKEIFDQQATSEQLCVIMPSGSNWSTESGFELNNHNYSLIEKHIEEAAIKHKHKIDKALKRSRNAIFNKNSFKSYYQKFFKSNNFIFKLSFRFGFLIEEFPSDSLFICIIDGSKKNTQIIKIKDESEIFNHNLSFVIKTATDIFNDCNIKMMHNTFGASKLLEIILSDSKSKQDLRTYLRLIDFYENDCLPISRLFSIRNISIALRRWREFFDFFYYIYIIKIKKGSIADLYFRANT